MSHNKLGDVASAAGDLTAARAAYEAGLAIIQRLAQSDPVNHQWQQDLQWVRLRLAALDDPTPHGDSNSQKPGANHPPT